MNQLLIIIILFSIVPSNAIAQNANWLKENFNRADSVLLVSHEATAGVKIVDSSGSEIQLPKLLIDGKPNYQIIKERKIINGKQLDSLYKILARSFEDRVVEMSKCFIPHHAILLFKNGKTSYIDICFGCESFDTSTDFKNLYAFDKRKWDELERYFRSHGFKYELE